MNTGGGGDRSRRFITPSIRVKAIDSQFASPGPREIEKCPIQGCSIGNGDILVTSSGVPSLEALIVGSDRGLPLGTITLIEEDGPRTMTNTATGILKCFISEGIRAGHQIILFDSIDPADRLIANLPSPSTSNNTTTQSETEDEAAVKMNIAWRYKHLQSFDKVNPPTAGKTFDLDRRWTLTAQQVNQIKIADNPNHFLQLAEDLAEQSRREKTVVRLVVRTIGGPCWPQLLTETASSSTGVAASRWLYTLRRIISRFGESTIAMLTTPPAVVLDGQSMAALRMQSDLAIALRSSEEISSPLAQEYVAFVQLIRPLRWPGSLAGRLPPTNDIAVRYRRRQIIIEPFHLPPDLGNDGEGNREPILGTATIAARSSDKSLEF